MSTVIVVVIIVVVIVAGVLVFGVMGVLRRRRLQERFGPEWSMVQILSCRPANGK